MNRPQLYIRKIVFNGKLNREKFAENKKKLIVSRQFQSYYNPQNNGNGGPPWWMSMFIITSVYFINKFTK